MGPDMNRSFYPRATGPSAHILFMARMREPLVLPFFAFCSGIILSRWVSFAAFEILPAMASLFVLALLASRRESWPLAWVAALLGFCATGVFVAELRQPPPKPQLDAAPGELVTLTGCVVEPPKFMPGREQFVLELAPGARARVNLYLKEGEAPPPLRYGERVTVEGRVRPPRNYANEGAFDVETFLARQRIFWTVSARSNAPIERLEQDCSSPGWAAIYRARSWLLERIDRLYGEDSPKIAALLIGESAGLDRDWTDSFRKTGTYHALVVSGTHVTLLAALLTVFLRAFFVPQIPALMLTASLAWFYALVAGASIPSIRAAAGFTFFLACRYLYRRARLLNIIAAVAWIFLVWDPDQLFDTSFQLSFGALAAIAGIALPLDERYLGPYRQALRRTSDLRHDMRLAPGVAQLRVELRLLSETVSLLTHARVSWVLRAAEWLGRPLLLFAALMLVSASIQLALAVPFVIYFHRFALSAVVANVGVATMLEMAISTGFTATITGLAPLVWATRWLINHASDLAVWHLRWEPEFRVPDPPIWLAVAAVLLVAVSAWALRRSARWGIFAVAMCAAAVITMVAFPFAAVAGRSELELTAVDVGQGDGLLVVFPDGTRMAVDAGGIPAFGGRVKPMDIGEAVVSPYLWTRAFRSIDIVAVTHAHADHMGGAKALVENFHPRELWITGLGRSPDLDALLASARSRGVAIRELRRGYERDFGGAHVRVAGPSTDAWNDGAPHNNDSLALLIRFGERSFFLPGDAERSLEAQFVYDESFGKIDVLKVAHHGGRTSTTFEFIEKAQPSLAVISVGEGNRYNHPHPEVLDRLHSRRATVLRTDRFGRITVRTDGRRLWYETYRWTQSR
jgi:competence protein ComEC